MQISSAENSNSMSFTGARNSFLKKSKNSLTQDMKYYYASLHHEAKSRLQYNKYERTFDELDKFLHDESTSKHSLLPMVKFVAKIIKYKIAGIHHKTKAYLAFPYRFFVPDNKCSNPYRYYKIKD